MGSRRILIIFGSSYGQTAKIATRIGDALVKRGHAVTLVDASKPGRMAPLTAFDGIVVGSSIIARGHQKSIKQFLRTRRALLERMPTAFFSVSASAASSDARGRAAAERVRDQFLKLMQWQPQLRASIAGAINYTRYNPILRWYMKRASAKNGGSTDTSRDHEYTDWTQVEQFAQDVGQLVESWPRVTGEPWAQAAPALAR